MKGNTNDSFLLHFVSNKNKLSVLTTLTVLLKCVCVCGGGSVTWVSPVCTYQTFSIEPERFLFCIIRMLFCSYHAIQSLCIFVHVTEQGVVTSWPTFVNSTMNRRISKL